MEHLAIRIPRPIAGAGGSLADLLSDWLARTPQLGDLVELRLRPDGEEAVATVREGARELEVRLHHEAGQPEDVWLLDASTWVSPAPPTRGWAVLAGLLMFLLGLVVSLRWLLIGTGPFLIGLGLSVIMGLLTGGMTWRRQNDRRATAATREAGGQLPAHDLVDRLAAVVRTDGRVLLLEGA